MKKILLALLAIALVAMTVGPAMAGVYTVTNPTGTEQNSLPWAVDQANASKEDSTISIQPGIGPIRLSTELVFKTNITLNGNGVTLQGASTRIANVTDGMAIFKALTFVGGSTTTNQDGGAVLVSGTGAAEFENCTFYNNVAKGNGGAVCIATNGGETTFRLCSISGNQAASQGGGVAVLDGVVRFIGNIIVGNTETLNNSSDDIYVNDVTASSSGHIREASYNVIGKSTCSSDKFSTSENKTECELSKVFSSGVLDTVTVNNANIQVLKLSSGSPARDYIPKDSYLVSDLKTDECGTTRPQLAAIDAGAFEALPIAVISADISGDSYVVINKDSTYTVNVYPPDATLDTTKFAEGIEWKAVPDNVLDIKNQGYRTTKVTALPNQDSKNEKHSAKLTATVHYWKPNANGSYTSADVTAYMGATSDSASEIFTGDRATPLLVFKIKNHESIKNQNVYLNETSSFKPELSLLMTTMTGENAKQFEATLPFTLDITDYSRDILSVDTSLEKNSSDKLVYLRGLSIGETTFYVRPNVYLGNNITKLDGEYKFTATVSQRTKSNGGGGGGCSAGFMGIAVLAVLTLALRRR